MLANFDISTKAAPTVEKKKDRRDKYKMSKKKANPDKRPIRDTSVTEAKQVDEFMDDETVTNKV
jgi:hypothetical protein